MFQIVIYTCVNVYQLKAFVVIEKCVVYRITCVAGRRGVQTERKGGFEWIFGGMG